MILGKETVSLRLTLILWLGINEVISPGWTEGNLDLCRWSPFSAWSCFPCWHLQLKLATAVPYCLVLLNGSGWVVLPGWRGLNSALAGAQDLLGLSHILQLALSESDPTASAIRPSCPGLLTSVEQSSYLTPSPYLIAHLDFKETLVPISDTQELEEFCSRCSHHGEDFPIHTDVAYSQVGVWKTCKTMSPRGPNCESGQRLLPWYSLPPLLYNWLWLREGFGFIIFVFNRSKCF